MENNRIEPNQRERDVLKVMNLVRDGKRTQSVAGRLLGLSDRQIRRIQRRLELQEGGAMILGLRGQPSNRRMRKAEVQGGGPAGQSLGASPPIPRNLSWEPIPAEHAKKRLVD